MNRWRGGYSRRIRNGREKGTEGLKKGRRDEGMGGGVKSREAYNERRTTESIVAKRGTPYKKYLDPKVLAKINGLELRARMAVEGYFIGTHRSPYRGLSVEFADHRSYSHGDDIRHIDWKVFGRTDKFYIKEYEGETNLSCMIVVDCSASMSYRSSGALMNKQEYAACVAASLSYIALQQRDLVGLAMFDERITEYIKPSSHPRQWKSVVRALAKGAGPEKTSIRDVLDDLSERLGRRTLVILISDLFDDGASTLLGLKRLRYQRNDVIVCNIWDPAELRFPFKGPTMFEGLEGPGRVMSEPQGIRSRYLEEVGAFVSRMRGECRAMRIDYVPFDTSMGLDVTISAYLATRSARIRQRSSRVLGGG